MAAPPAAERRTATGLLLRFISCGLISLVAGGLWRFTLAPRQLRIGSALVGVLILLGGFVVGGVLWYLRDARARIRNPEAVDDERIVYSFVVFVAVPFLVIALVGVIYLVALLIGAH